MYSLLYKSFRRSLFYLSDLIGELVIDQALDVKQCVELKNLGLRMLAGSQAAKVRVAGLEILQQLFSPATNLSKIETAADELDVDSIVKKHLFGILAQTSRVSGSITQVTF